MQSAQTVSYLAKKVFVPSDSKLCGNDIALIELREGNFEFLDNYGNKRTGNQRFFPSGTVLGGKRIARS